MKHKFIDMSDMEVVSRGQTWTHKYPPNSKKVAKYLECNESCVTWVCPRGGDVLDQIPCIQCGDAMHALSLRMMKGIYRHVRLKKGFCNVESNEHGKLKLKIPQELLAEKIRTQTRFNSMRLVKESRAITHVREVTLPAKVGKAVYIWLSGENFTDRPGYTLF